jgi:hypothetical protein
MKQYKIDSKRSLFEVVVPTGEGAADDGLFDDCPACQELRKAIGEGQSGEAEVVIQWEDDDAN